MNRHWLIVAGGHNESSLGWAAAEAWLRRDSSHRLLLTARSAKALEFADAQRTANPGRINVVQIDWTSEDAAGLLGAELKSLIGSDRSVAGAVHAVAASDPANFADLAHTLSPQVYLDTFDATVVSLLRLVTGCVPYLSSNAGIVTFGFGEFRSISREYGPALSIAKLALAQATAVLGISLGEEDPPARTLEIVTGLIPTYAARGVAAGISKGRASRVSAQDMADQFIADAPLAGTSADGQRAAAGELAVSFISDAPFKYTTGERIHVDGGWTTTAKPVIPSGVPS